MSRCLQIGMAALLFYGCSDDGMMEEIDHETCLGDEQVLEAGLTQEGASGLFQIEILDWAPRPLQVGNNDMSIRITDTEGVPVDDVTFDLIETWQRVHNHGSPIEPVATVESAPGEWLIEKLNVIHRGSWYFRFEVSAAGQQDRIEFNLGVDCLVFAD